jgi:phosphate transport system permease protein
MAAGEPTGGQTATTPRPVPPDTATAAATGPADTAVVAAGPERPDVLLGGRSRPADRAFRVLVIGASGLVLLVMVAIAAFLVARAIPAITANTANFLTEQGWDPDGDPSRFGIGATLYFTLLTSAIAMALAVPVAVGTALFMVFYAPRRISTALGYCVELLAAVPSIVYGLWGFAFLAPRMSDLVLWLDRWFGWTVVLRYRPQSEPNNFSPLVAGVVLAIMILPIISSLSREVFRRVPTDQIEGALALGYTRFEMLRRVVLPLGRPGVVAASILGLGRALGETLAVTMLLSTAYHINIHITETGGVTFASVIVLKYGEAGERGTGALIAAGLCLFLLTLAVNLVARVVLRRERRI